MGVPVDSRGSNRCTDLIPGFKTPTFKSKGPQHFPPRLNQVKVGGILGLKNKLPTGQFQLIVASPVRLQPVQTLARYARQLHPTRAWIIGTGRPARVSTLERLA